ncbi:MAG: Uma2 family endonuclease [Microcoleus sp. PH2017_29_MFU_D_A]|jgi:Uma2 family endonuclease|uniref:Uma2 family endonuclease n=1 Tax=unclassified Microcoleus TaxID=2642155 RepID=UPI001E071E97|nr:MULTISPECIES: Uma2 family endonuclease [unclassified Microcoleus]MCC3431903.1 Uma2 family endonuclease [Microcoleus sp. PH2017_04_SCI_O_A]MCC3444141.1 Uma2 family endonuclease [Microcoleus sp. PH2017_03_ELD_O_A]MCC3468970.1 Uma2 family endonuclease [Microcoleus sp. PH2017_06_SFM_O_A]MCC3507197.1 Uma2 family endonuclease [Microcoleus sp. PH2017_19_SFW_U_A]TAE05751.1 MAG: Uma2 family endonuclease [Oscillatoriales cyanobacterium]
MMTLKLDLSPWIELTDDQFYELCQHHRDYKFERNAKGELLMVPPTGGETGNRNMDLSYQLQSWSRRNPNLGIAFDSSTCFKLPNGGNRSPDASWVKRERWEALTAEERRKFPPLCPDFVVELRSPTDSIKETREKMQEYRENGACLGWLIDPQTRSVEIYRSDREIEILQSPVTLSGEDILPGFVLELRSVMGTN